ncbi:MAG: hypothetical protein ACK5NG_07275 [Chthoniobacterales bacterium]
MGIETQSFPESAGEGWSGRTEQLEEKANYDIEGKWFFEHPEVMDERFGKFHFGAQVTLPTNEAVASPEDCIFGDYFVAKFSSLASALKIDAVLFRDHVFTKAYVRGFGGARYMPPAWREELNEAIANVFRGLKAKNPSLITIGYSSGSSAMEEWRSHGFDLEALANTGCLDLWITQTWASAWQDYWPAHGMGFTFQLTSLLTHAAMLAKSPTKHLFVLETFDAWEPWDSIHQYPSKVAWEISAYSHATVKESDGQNRRVAGFYLSWLHRSKELLPEKTVSQVCGWLNDTQSSLADNPTPGGPCLVYDRAGLLASINSPSDFSRGEELDDYCAMLLKFGVPVLSVVRRENMMQVEADGWIIPTMNQIDRPMLQWLRNESSAGHSILLLGSPDCLEAEVRDDLKLKTIPLPRHAQKPDTIHFSPEAAELVDAQGAAWNQFSRSLETSDAWETQISALGGPVFSQLKETHIFFWEPPEWGTPTELHLTTRSTGSPEGWQAVAGLFAANGWGKASLKFQNEDLQKPVCFLFWRYPLANTTGVLLGNLETGTMGNSQFCVRAKLTGLEKVTFDEKFQPVKHHCEGDLHITLSPHAITRLTANESIKILQPLTG